MKSALPLGVCSCGPPDSSTPSLTAMIGAPTSTICPSSARRAVTVPAKGMGSSTRDLEVSISTTMSLILTSSPTATRQVTISASTSPSPGSGRRNSFVAIRPLPAQYANDLSTASSTRSRSGR